MGLFVVARLAARHGIRVRLRPASMGGLTALVWLPDEVITHETSAAPGLRRFEVTAPGAATPAASPAGMTERPEPGQSEDYAAADSALGAEGLDAGAPDAAGLPASAQPEEANRLPIFESVESDWFRRGGHADSAVLVASAGTWSSPADEGWRAAEVAHSPVLGGSTVAGLPRRVPQANLVPGGVAATSPAPPAPTRSAAETRDRLTSFQRGMREARATADGDGPPDEQDRAR